MKQLGLLGDFIDDGMPSLWGGAPSPNPLWGNPADDGFPSIWGAPRQMPAASRRQSVQRAPQAPAPAPTGILEATVPPQQNPMTKRGLLGGYDDEPQGLFGALQQGVMNPMFLGGAALLSGEGMGGAFRGMQVGQGFQDERRQRAMEQQKNQQFEGLLGQFNAPPEVVALARMQGPQAGAATLGEWIGPAQEARKLELDYKRAQIAKMQREAASGGDMPSNVREWQYYQSLSPEQKQQYLTMKRAEKWLDTGTQFVSPSPGGGGGVPRTVDKNVAEKNRQEEVGKARGIAEASLPTVLNASQRMLATIDAVDQDPNLDKVTGFVGGRIPKHLQTEAMAETQSRVEQIQGQTFLQAYNDLRGAGQITEREGAAAQAAYNRLTTQTMGTKAYRAALKEFRGEVDKLVGIAKQKAGVSDNGNTLQSRGGGSFIQPGSMDLGSGFSLEFE